MIHPQLIDYIPYIDPMYDGRYRIALESVRWERAPNSGVVGIIWFTAYGCNYNDTRKFCEAVGMNGEEMLVWVLKFGEQLPRKWHLK